MRTASAAQRADATHALARVYLYSDLSPDDRAAVESALVTVLDDPSPKVRGALARALAFSESSPPPLYRHGIRVSFLTPSWWIEINKSASRSLARFDRCSRLSCVFEPDITIICVEKNPC